MMDQLHPSSVGGYGRRSRPVTPEAPGRFSYDTAGRREPNTISELLHGSVERPQAFSDDELLPRFSPRSREASRSASQTASRARRSRRAHKPQPGGAFLLQEAVVSDDDNAIPRRPLRSKGRVIVDQPSASIQQEPGLGINSGTGTRARVVSPDTSQEDLFVRKRMGSKTSQQASSALDVDSTQIVNMALNLSESRRIASRRNFSRTNPPRLAPIQDTSAGSNLKTHLQQQRKTIRNASPNPNQSLTPRIPGVRSNSPLRPPFDAGHDTSYRYHFSTSTLSRAQKARDHLELMAQYRRLLETLPPLKLGFDRPAAASPPGSPLQGKPSRLGPGTYMVTGGREYNPLQYIRNRKVRARERMTIDGDTQGFSDVDSVKLWVDKVSYSSDVDLTQGHSTLPPFPGAEDEDTQMSPEAAAKGVSRLRRPRVDWFFEPCDMVADAYWLEKDHHKQLIEDRHWRKVFPQATDLTRPLSRQDEQPEPAALPILDQTFEEPVLIPEPKNAESARPDHEVPHGSAKDRAKQKLHEMGPFHRHTSSSHSHHGHHELLRKRRDSMSDSSDSEAEVVRGKPKRTRRNRAGTLSSDANDLLEKQMMEMIAQEERQRLSNVIETEAEHQQAESSATPEHGLLSKSNSLRRNNQRKWSLTDESDHRSSRELPRAGFASGFTLGKQDFERARNVKPKVEDIDSPQPMSPELNATQYNLSAVSTGLDLSAPSSRSSSPTRNPFSKVKHIFRDKTREDEGEAPAAGPEESDHRPAAAEPSSPIDGTTSPARQSSVPRPAYGAHRHHRSTSSVKLRGDDQIGLRGMFKGPRIDTVIRGGVSRLGDMLWKKEGQFDVPFEAFSTDESESEQARGRARASLQLSRTNSRKNRTEGPTTKHFLDTMPQFQHVSEQQGKFGSIQSQRPAQDPIKVSNQPLARPDTAKPPKLNVPNPTVSAPVLVSVDGRAVGTDSSDSKPAQDGVDKKKLTLPEVPKFDMPRKWSIADRGSPEEFQLSRREIARLRASILSSGITAMEISRRSCQPKKPLVAGSLKGGDASARSSIPSIPWPEIAKLTPAASLPSDEKMPYCDHYSLASRTLGVAVETSIEKWQDATDQFTSRTRPKLEERIWCVRSRIADELSGMTGQAADLADETGKDLSLGQLLKVKHVTDLIETMMRNRRRRFRWLRRGMWSIVEWMLVGIMWYVWLIVTVFRLFLGVGHGILGGVRWLLWL